MHKRYLIHILTKLERYVSENFDIEYCSINYLFLL
jgi:hypothetical protein